MIPSWVTPQFYDDNVQYHLLQLMSCQDKKAAAWHWKLMLYYRNEFSIAFNVEKVDIKVIYEACKAEMPDIAKRIEEFELLEVEL